MSRNLLPALAFVFLVAGCGSSEDPIDAEFGTGTLTASVGPGGGVLRGRGATELNGFALEVPAGALRELVQVEVRLGDALDLPGTEAVAPGVRVSVNPDPGPLLRPAILRMPVRLPVDRDSGDLLVAGSVPSWAAGSAVGAVGLAAKDGSYDTDLQVFTTTLGQLTDHQVRITSEPRQGADARAFRDLAIDALRRQTDAGLIEADQHLAAAIQADPYDPDVRLLRAMSRVLVLANDRRDDGPGIDSVGEAMTAWGLDLRSRSLLRRFVDNDWPRVFAPLPNRPAIADLVAFLQTTLRPAMAAGLRDLQFVPSQRVLALELPTVLAPWFPGLTEFDAADTLFLSSFFEFTGYVLDGLEDLDTDMDIGEFLASPTSIAVLLARYPGLGRQIQAPGDATRASFQRGGRFLELALDALRGEADDQSDDLVTFPDEATAAEIDQLTANLNGLVASFASRGSSHPLLYRDREALEVDLSVVASGLDYRSFLPGFSRCDPIAGSLTDPTAGGLFPGLDQDAATRWFGFVTEGSMLQASIVIDGDFRDWPATTEQLLPRDPSGDAALLDFDLERLWVARTTGGDLCCRLSLAGGSFLAVAGRQGLYGIELQGQADVPAVVAPVVRLTISVSEDGPALSLVVDGEPIEIESRVAAQGSEIEFSVPRDVLFPAGEPLRSRVLRAFSEARDQVGTTVARDATRWVVLPY